VKAAIAKVVEEMTGRKVEKIQMVELDKAVAEADRLADAIIARAAEQFTDDDREA
jgi:hypothetical protein